MTKLIVILKVFLRLWVEIYGVNSAAVKLEEIRKMNFSEEEAQLALGKNDFDILNTIYYLCNNSETREYKEKNFIEYVRLCDAS